LGWALGFVLVGGILAIKMATVAAALATCAACTTTGRYDPKYFAPLPIASDKVLAGRALIQMTAEDEAYVFSGRPTTVVGSAGTLVLPLGQMTREAALNVFGAVFRGGSEAATAVPPARKGFAVIVSPRVERFSYAYGFGELRPALAISVAVLDPEGRTLLDRRTYESTGSAAVSREQPVESISRTMQLLVQSLMLRAATDARARLVEAPSGG
jgi:hypothetical protein